VETREGRESIEQAIEGLEKFLADEGHAFPPDHLTADRIRALIAAYREAAVELDWHLRKERE